ncbi:MAG: DEAD/DEAH box helicase [Burkholderiaceae bacterium]|jgi:non-specific serine/threonine protein kinase|nr:DEAD/DEAH box helicase [Burkholderiaceae bacterium]
MKKDESASAAFDLALSPAGTLFLEARDDAACALAPALAARLRGAFARGSAQGLLHLGAVELSGTLPPALGFAREFAHRFMARLTALPTLAEDWAHVSVTATPAEFAAQAAAVPPMTGAEYLDAAMLAHWWSALHDAVRADIAAHAGDVAAWLQGKHPSWNLVGRVCLHLAENKRDEAYPFAFLATCASHLARDARMQHVPLGQAVQQLGAQQDRAGLLKLLLPVHTAAEQNPWFKTLVDSGQIYQPQAWTAREAHRFLCNIPAFESSGLVVRIPDWWKPRQPPRPQVLVRLGQQAAGLGLNTLLNFDLQLTLGDQTLTAEEWEQLHFSDDGLVRLKGQWVEVDRAKLDAVLAHWKKVQRAAAEGVSWAEGMRLLAGATLDADVPQEWADTAAAWSNVSAGDWLRDTLAQLRAPDGTRKDADPAPELQAQLRLYQRQGVQWLWWLYRLGLGGCLADDMGLGKTLQVLALFSLVKRHAGQQPPSGFSTAPQGMEQKGPNGCATSPASAPLTGIPLASGCVPFLGEGETSLGEPSQEEVSPPHLLVVPASLIGNWQAEAQRFAPHLRWLIAHPSALPSKQLADFDTQELRGVDIVITSYGTLTRLPWLTETPWSLVVLDEAQAIKNPGAQQTRKVKALKSRARFALTGTPIENRLGDLWSLFDFVCPGLLGSAAAFNRYSKRLAAGESQGYGPLRQLVQPYLLRRLKSDKRVIADLPDKIEMPAFCVLSKAQARLYQQAVGELTQILYKEADGIQRRGAVLAFLMRFKQICNHPSQWLGDNVYAAQDSGKFARLRALAEEIAARQEKVLVFTQFQEITAPLAAFLQGLFGRPGLVLHGGTAVKARQALVKDFQREQGPPFFVLSLKAGGAGLNLTAASHVIHFDRWWNPAVENQATDRAYRIGQQRKVLVHKFVCRGTVEEKIDTLIAAKRELSEQIVEGGGGEALLTEMSNEELLRVVALDLNGVLEEA